jgi:hypothetical protein
VEVTIHMLIDPESICPNPPEWAKLHTAAVTATKDGETFPKPLILAGWAFSSDEEKRQRWAETIQWLEERKLGYLVEAKVGDSWYRG